VSFLENEIYEAALYHNDVHIFLMEPFNPDSKLNGLLEIIRTIRPDIVPNKILAKQDMLDAIERIISKTKNTRRRKWSLSLRKLVGQLAYSRGYPNPDIEFFDKVFHPVSARPDKDHLRILLEDITDELSIEKRLTRMWIALRELSAAPYNDASFKEFLPYWNQALGVWAGAASWYGLHGHLYAGRLAAVNSLIDVRQRLKASGSKPDATQRDQGDLGGRASEYYSIAKLIQPRAEKQKYLHLALADVEAALSTESGDVSGHLAVRGHIHFRLGRLRDASRDFQEMLRLREQRGDLGGVGEAKADLALIKIKQFGFREARNLLLEGVSMLDAAGSFTFAIRARKRLALAHLMSGHPRDALTVLLAAHEIAEANQVYDQITPLMETLSNLKSRLRE
jgi:tetratricopeptide (TPR) repeat protein